MFILAVQYFLCFFLSFLSTLAWSFHQRRNKNIQSGLQVATGPGCMEVQTAVRRNLICGVQGDRACISISRRHSCSRKHTGILQAGTTLPLFGISRLREGSPCQSGADHNWWVWVRLWWRTKTQASLGNGRDVSCVCVEERAAPSTDLTSSRTHP